jgi:ribosomal protein S8E
MFTFEITRGYTNSAIAGQLGDCFLTPSSAAKSIGKLKKEIDEAKNGALRMTAARLRKRILEAFDQNTLKWPEHTEYSNWLGLSNQPVSIAGLAASNRPKRTETRSGKAKARGYSRKTYIRPPKQRPLGGKFRNMMRYEVDLEAGNFKVGMLENKVGTVLRSQFDKFQEGGILKVYYGDPFRVQRYFAALGIYLRKYPIFKVPKRPLMGPIRRLYPPDKLMQEAFEQKLSGEK